MDWASLETQQAAELAVKGALRAGITDVTAHSVVKVPGHFGEAVPEAIQRCSRGLDSAYIRSGYPDAYASGPPMDYTDHDAATQAIDCARQILGWLYP